MQEYGMLIRCAFFEGRVRDDQDAAFHSFVSERLVPLWTRFPGANEVRVLSQVQSDTDTPHYAMVLSIQYPDADSMQKALQSEVRNQSRDVTAELVKLFEGRIFHTVFDLRHSIVL
jgi:hypothetical protein